ncbi:calmodulin-lysine N-methyltransferase-like [Biomphalaria glabrata]|uniref:Calmodulin-lysine N-methyltransferase n=2 Tax=Biomphalaria glabrata TaxID=6526 RepID=A0A9W2ZUD8_BIOGL|nr:calmodulin-lysine N-methyltransferase-like [Biomphalaria glabrata]
MMNYESIKSDLGLSDRRKIAKKRWLILAKVLNGSSCEETADSTVSIRRFHSFGLMSQKSLTNDLWDTDKDSTWYLYTCQDIPGFSMHIRHLSGGITAERLNGFNNTGNVCVWPSEEVMTYYCMQHVQDFKGLRICELGGGMTCLAGVALGVCSEAAHVELTDGNEESIKNLQSIISNNTFDNTTISTRLLRWGSEKVEIELQSSFDIVICADCLFFDEGRVDLVQMFFDLLKPGGEALIFAPSRNKTFHQFAEMAQELFEVKIDQNYDSRVLDLHFKMLKEMPDIYNESLHFPMMMRLSKQHTASSSREVTPESR